jgi:hypothetical protein
LFRRESFIFRITDAGTRASFTCQALLQLCWPAIPATSIIFLITLRLVPLPPLRERCEQVVDNSMAGDLRLEQVPDRHRMTLTSQNSSIATERGASSSQTATVSG